MGEGVAGLHDLTDGGEAAAEVAAGVEAGEVAGLEVEAAAYVEREGIAEGEHGRGGCRGGELVGAGFAGDGDVEGVRAGGSEGGCVAAAEADEGDAEAGKDGEQAEELFGFAGVREG